MGEYNFYYLVKEGYFPEALAKETAVTYLAGFFRSVRFGVDEAHGKAVMAIFNYLRERGAYVKDPATGILVGRFHQNSGCRQIALDGDSHARGARRLRGAKAFMDKYAQMDPELKAQLDGLTGIPVDIEPRFVIEGAFGGTLK